jgi:hypothetical protein
MAATDRRSEQRTPADLPVQVYGVDNDGKRFAQAATAKSISPRGALLLGLEQELRSGDLIKIQSGDGSATFRVVWVSPGTLTGGLKVAVQRIEADPCIWADRIVKPAELPARHN